MMQLPRALAAALALTIAAPPAFADVTIHYDATTGTFQPWFAVVRPGDTVTWTGLDRQASIVRIDAPLGVDACDPDRNTRPFTGAPNDFTGPTRRGVSGIWALGPEGDAVSMIELDALATTPDAACAALNDGQPIGPFVDADGNPRERLYQYRVHKALSGEPLGTLPPVQHWVYGTADGGANSVAPGADGRVHALCAASTWSCPPGVVTAGDDRDLGALGCTSMRFKPARPETIPPGALPNGLLQSTYDDPDITGVVLRFSWSDLQVDDHGTITDRWIDLDRELDRAVAAGKLVTLDVRAGAEGTPPWIFTDYPDAVSSPSAAATPWLRQVVPLEFHDHYDEQPPGIGCGMLARIGSPGDPAYRALYTDFIARLAAHVASDTRWFQALAHVKVSGANLLTSEAELPHHCDDQYVNTADHHEQVKVDRYQPFGDGVLDVFKERGPGGARTTTACDCTTRTWFFDDHYTPERLYGYYAQVEHTILTRFFGRKSMGYQLIQDGFPRADADRDRDGVHADVDPSGDTGSFYGDHLWEEVLVDATGAADPAGPFNAGFYDQQVCTTPSTVTDGTTSWPHLLWSLGAGTSDWTYCSADLATWPTGSPTPPSTYQAHAELDVVPVAVAPTRNGLAYPDDGNGVRFPDAHSQTQAVMDQAGRGRFSDPTVADTFDPVRGRLFVPQHSGIQPLTDERAALGYANVAGVACLQTVAPDGAATPSAQFPIDRDQRISHYWEPGSAGCPNWWAVTEGVHEDHHTVTYGQLSRWLFGVDHYPAQWDQIDVPLRTPPQLTGFQTTNKVRNTAMVESALFNLVYNTNAVFIELYEDSLWRIRVAKGGGPLQDRLTALSQPGAACDGLVGTGRCYTKSLAAWSDELHARRTEAAAQWAHHFGVPYPALEDPFPSSYAFTFGAPSGLLGDVFSYVDPARCDPTRVDSSAPPAGPSALGVILLRP